MIEARSRGRHLEALTTQPEKLVRELLARDEALADLTVVAAGLEDAFLGVIMGARGMSLAVPTYVLATYGVFGVLGPALFGFGAGLANERDTGVLLLKQTTPMPAGAYLFAKVMAALIFGAVVVMALFLMAAHAAGVALYRWQWFALAGVLLAGVIPFCALGLAIGAWARGRSAIAVVNLVFLPMAMLSGLWPGGVPEETFALVDVAAFDGEAFRQGWDVWVEDGRIRHAGQRLDLPDDVPRLDGRGHTLIPGLIDGHVHSFPSTLGDALRFGVTTVLDQSTDPAFAQTMRPAREEVGRGTGADLFFPPA